MKKLIVTMLVVLALTLAIIAPAFAHVHGVTPLNDCGKANANAGGIGTDGTPADDANDGPITGLIPRDTGNEAITAGGGGFGATNGHCP